MEGSAANPAAALSIPELESRITELAGHLNAANHRWLLLIADFDRRQGWSDSATQSCAHWLNWRCGIDMGAAREKLRVAHALEKLPKISDAMARGELSYSKVRALTRVAAAETEDLLLSIALHGTAHHVETVVRHFRRARQTEELSREARQQANRRVDYYYDDDGSLVLKASLPAEAGALLVKAFEAALEERSSPNVSAEKSKQRPTEEKPSYTARRADALAVIAESFLANGAAALAGGERHQVVVHVDAITLRDDTAGRCELERGPGVPAETARRLSCDASVVALVENAKGEPLDIGRKSRSIPPAIRRALNARDRGCRFPGCPNTRFVDGHHVRHWAQGGQTKLSNLVSLCRFHHRQVHEGGVVIQRLDDGALRFVRPDGRSFDSIAPGHAPTQGDWTRLPATHREQGIVIDRHTATTRWRGESMDYGMAIDGLLYEVRRAREVPAETSWR